MTKEFKVTDVFSAGAYFNWAGGGFGQFSFGVKDGVWHCENECMGPESVRKILHTFADHVADNLTPVIEAEMEEFKKWRAERIAEAEKVNTPA